MKDEFFTPICAAGEKAICKCYCPEEAAPTLFVPQLKGDDMGISVCTLLVTKHKAAYAQG